MVAYTCILYVYSAEFVCVCEQITLFFQQYMIKAIIFDPSALMCMLLRTLSTLGHAGFCLFCLNLRRSAFYDRSQVIFDPSALMCMLQHTLSTLGHAGFCHCSCQFTKECICCVYYLCLPYGSSVMGHATIRRCQSGTTKEFLRKSVG